MSKVTSVPKQAGANMQELAQLIHDYGTYNRLYALADEMENGSADIWQKEKCLVMCELQDKYGIVLVDHMDVVRSIAYPSEK